MRDVCWEQPAYAAMPGVPAYTSQQPEAPTNIADLPIDDQVAWLLQAVRPPDDQLGIENFMRSIPAPTEAALASFQQRLVTEFHWPPSLLLSAPAVLRAFKATHAGLTRSVRQVSVTDCKELLHQILFDAAKHVLRVDQGADFDLHTYIPEQHALVVGGETMATWPQIRHECYIHKDKLLVAHVRKHGTDISSAKKARKAAADKQQVLFIKKAHSVDVASKEPDQLGHIAAILNPSMDAQNSAVVSEYFQNPAQQQALHDAGHHITAISLKVIGNAQQAWDTPGLTAEERDKRLDHLRLLFLTAAGNMPKLAPRLCEATICGYPRDLVLSIVGNVEGRAFFKLHVPQFSHILVERSLCQDDLETSFSQIVTRLGWKATWRAISSVMRNIDIVTAMRRDPDLGFHVKNSAQSSYPHHVSNRLRGNQWNDGSILRPSATCMKKHLAAVHRAALRVATPKPTIRDAHTHNAGV